MLRALVALFLFACSSPPALNGQVVDVWGEPVAGVTVKMAGHTDRPITDAYGRFGLPLAKGAYRLKAGRKGYIQQDVQLQVLDEEYPPKPVIQLYPQPQAKGFFLVGGSAYVPIVNQPVTSSGSTIKRYYGIRQLGEAQVPAGVVRVVFHTGLRIDQVYALSLQLHQLVFRNQVPIESVVTNQMELNLWVSERTVPIAINPLGSTTDYLLQTPQALAPGAYALVTQNLLTPPADEDFRNVAKPLRMVFPFVVQ